ncbi:MAG: hypothetical protein EOO65_02410, partial [Methanosarcinales archaeon]
MPPRAVTPAVTVADVRQQYVTALTSAIGANAAGARVLTVLVSFSGPVSGFDAAGDLTVVCAGNCTDSYSVGTPVQVSSSVYKVPVTVTAFAMTSLTFSVAASKAVRIADGTANVASNNAVVTVSMFSPAAISCAHAHLTMAHMQAMHCIVGRCPAPHADTAAIAPTTFVASPALYGPTAAATPNYFAYIPSS